MRVIPHVHETERLASLRSYHVLDTAPEEDFDAVTRLAAAICDAPISTISLVDQDRQWFLSSFGLHHREDPRTESVCSDVVASGMPVVVGDLSGSPRYVGLKTVAEPNGLRAYAGVPITGRDGLPLGSLCVADTTARGFSPAQVAALKDLARHVVTALELRRADSINGRDALVAEAREPLTLRRALEGGEFVPYFQPVVDLGTGIISGLEALIRWQHPTLGLLTPDAFLPGLEVGALADWTGHTMLAAACRAMVELSDQGTELRDGVAVNVSGRQLTEPGLAEAFLQTLSTHGLTGAALTVEVTETAEIADVVLARRELQTLRDAGARVVADDFGVGWSNLVRLLELPLSGLKIDRQLVSRMADDPLRRQMVASTISLAASMGLDTVAEGVETEAVRDLLLELGCDRGQGWLYGRAVPAADLPALFARPE